MTINVPLFAAPPIQTMQWVKNGRYPDAWWQSVLSQEANKAVAWRTKQLATVSVPIPSIPASDGNRTRWRFACHTSTHVSFVWVRFVLATGSLTAGIGGLPTGDLRATLSITDGGAFTGTAEFHFGATVSPPGDKPSYFAEGTEVINDGTSVLVVPPDTDLFGTFSDGDNGRLISATVYETSLDPTTANGYCEGGQVLFSPIYDEDSGDLTVLLRGAWKAGAAHAWTWGVQLASSPRTRTTATFRNLIDSTSTSLTTASIGATLDETNRGRISETALGVPVAVWVYGSQSAGAAGTVRLVDAGGGTIDVSITGAAGWYSTAGYVASSRQKFDLHLKGNGVNTTSVWAVSVVPYQA